MQPTSLDPQAAFYSRLVSPNWNFRDDGSKTGAENMEVDLELLHAASRGNIGPSLRFYGWAPTAVSLGRFQNGDSINFEALKRNRWDLVRRPTGGRAVLHQHEVTYSIVLPPSVVGNAGVRTSHAVLTELLNAGLRRLLPTNPIVPPPNCDSRANRTSNCFALTGECDTVTNAGKLVGSAQARHNGALLQHGSILLDADRDAWTEIFGECGRLVTLRELMGRVVEPGEVHRALLDEFAHRGITFEAAML